MIALLAPWQAVEATRAQGLGVELKKEVGRGHSLFGYDVTALAIRSDMDDVLFRLEGKAESFAVVHLTYSGRIEADPQWPQVSFYANLVAWMIQMNKDHADYIGL